MARAKGYLAFGTALIACPCHLPIVAAVLAGTALGTAISQNYGLLVPLMGLYFVAALLLGMRWLSSQDASKGAPVCEPCETSPIARQSGMSQRTNEEPASTRNGTPTNGHAEPELAGLRRWPR